MSSIIVLDFVCYASCLGLRMPRLLQERAGMGDPYLDTDNGQPGDTGNSMEEHQLWAKRSHSSMTLREYA
jgi:hypothetical protein